MTIRATVNNQGLWGRYVPVEYIQSTGAAYINTNIIRINVVFECDMKFDSTTARSLLGHSATQGHYFGKDATNHPELGGGVNIPTVDATERHTYSYWYDTEGHLEVAGQSIQRGGSQAPTAPFQTVLSGYAGPHTLYKLRVLDGATILRDFVPVKDTTTGKYGMWDRVEGRFYGNVGTGSFTGGSEIKRIGYLESTGAQYMDLGMKGNQDTAVYLDFQNTSGTGMVFGSRTSATSNAFAIWTSSGVISSTLRVGFDSTGGYTGPEPKTDRINIKADKVEVIRNNVKVYDVPSWSNFTTPGNLLLFAYDSAGTITYSIAKIFSCRLWQNNVLVRELIPVKLGTTGYMLDTVEWKLYANAGTGSFTLGPEIRQEEIRLIKAKVNGQMKTINSARIKISGQMREIYHAMV